MPEIGRGHENRVEIRVLGEHLLGIEVALASLALEILDPAVGGADPVLHDVRGRDVAQAGNILHGVEEDFVLLAAADESDANLVGGGVLRLGPDDGRGPEHEAGSRHGSLFQEVAALDAAILVLHDSNGVLG